MSGRSSSLKTLRRRHAFLDAHIADVEATGDEWGGLDFDKAERAALAWALEQLDPTLGDEVSR